MARNVDFYNLDAINAFLRFNEREILDNPGKVTQEIAKAFTESEYEKYRLCRIACSNPTLIVISNCCWKTGKTGREND